MSFYTQTKIKEEEASARERHATIRSMGRIHIFVGSDEDNSLYSFVMCHEKLCFEKLMGNALCFQHFPVLHLTEQWWGGGNW